MILFLRGLFSLVLLMALGNIAIAGYLLWALFRLPADAPLERLLLRPTDTGPA